MERNKWIDGTPEIKEECVFVSASKWHFPLGEPYYEYGVWEVKLLEGIDEADKPMYYFGLITGDGDVWGDLADFRCDKFYIIDTPPSL